MSVNATLDHFDIPVSDVERMAAFLERVFGWTAERVSDSKTERYWRLPASAADSRSAGVRVGLFEGSMEVLEHPLPVVRLDGEPVEACLDRVIASGGKVVLEPREIGASGRFARFADPDGHEWALWAPSRC